MIGSKRSRRLRWTACALAAVAGLLTLAACGDGDNDVTTRPAAPAAADVSGSDRHLENIAADANRGYVYSGGQADSLGYQAQARANAATPAAADVSGSDRHLENMAADANPGYVYSGGQADSLGHQAQARANAATSARMGGQAAAYARAQQVEAEREEAAQRAAQAEALAHLDGQARTHGR
jgi:hypothetical protein